MAKSAIGSGPPAETDNPEGTGTPAAREEAVARKARFCLVFERELLSVPVMRQVLGDTLRRIGVNEDSVDDILLAVTEACTNVVLHAGQSAPGYTVAATVGGSACRLVIADAGRGCYLPAGRTPDACPDACLDGRPEGWSAASLAESGRGFAVMRACMDTVTLRSAPGRGTRVVLGKRIDRGASLTCTA
jgi:serine/threonine-protein kinase RsbW